MCSKDFSNYSVENEFEMSWERKQEIKLEGYCKSPVERGKTWTREAAVEMVRKLEIY